MKILLDECITKLLKAHLANHTVYTVANMKWLGMKNGNLLRSAVNEGFDVLLTIDKNLQFQNNMNNYNIALVILDTKSSKLEPLMEFIPIFEKQKDSFEKGNIYILKKDK